MLILETPLTLAAQLGNTVEVIKALKNGGAHLDFRAKDGMTALHKAARAKNQVTLKVSSFRGLLCVVFYRAVYEGKYSELIINHLNGSFNLRLLKCFVFDF